METLKINCPEGYEIDKEKSTFGEIVFKKKESFPMRWEELNIINGYYVGSGSSIISSVRAKDNYINRNVFPSKEEAEAMLAMAQLCQLRDAWNKEWKPNRKNENQKKYVIKVVSDQLYADSYWSINCPMSFKTRETRDLFMTAFKDLLEIAKPFL